MRTESTPRFIGTPGQTPRFAPRPSPERLAAQVCSFKTVLFDNVLYINLAFQGSEF